MPRRALCFVASLVLAASISACGGSSGSGAAAPASSATASSTTASTASTTSTTSVTSARPFKVTRRDVTVEDTSRPTAADPQRGLEEKPSRTLPLMILAPDGAGPFPLVVFSHGVTATGPTYEGFLDPLAAAGYVVIAPTFPLSSGPSGTIPDYANQPGDVFFSLDSVITMANDANDPLHGKLDVEKIALAGHSLGAMTTVGAALNSCCTQARVDAAILLAPIQVDFPNGDFSHRTPVPLLIAHGTADETLPFDGSVKLYDAATGPTAFLQLQGGTHSGILIGDDGALLQRTMLAWLDRWVRGDTTAFDPIPSAVAASGIAVLETKAL